MIGNYAAIIFLRFQYWPLLAGGVTVLEFVSVLLVESLMTVESFCSSVFVVVLLVQLAANIARTNRM
jgi:hypothetical protein